MGALAFNFKRKGQFLLALEKISEDELTELALDNEAEDILTEEDHYEVVCETSEFDRLAEAFERRGIEPDSSELAYLPNTLVEIKDEETARKLMNLIESLEELEDVKSVHGNYDIDKALLQNSPDKILEECLLWALLKNTKL